MSSQPNPLPKPRSERSRRYGHYSTWRDASLVDTPDLSVVIPAYNERERILPTIASLCGHLCAGTLDWELIVSDDGSTDGTAELINSLGMANVRVVGDGINRGKGAAVRRGLRAARGQMVLFTDADMSTPAAELDAMVAQMQAGADVVVGSRAANGASTSERSPLRRTASWTLRQVQRTTLPTGVSDTQCGFKLFRREAARELAALQRLDGFAFDMELLFVATRLGMRVVEQPVAWVDAPGSKVSPGVEAIRFLRDMARIRANAALGRYSRRTMAQGLHVAVVTTLPPSKRTLNEYGHHLVNALADKPEIARLSVLHDECGPVAPQVPEGVEARAAWRFDSLATLPRLVREVRRLQPDVVFFNIQFAFFGNRKVPAALGLLAPAVLRTSGVPSMVLLHNLVDTVDLETAGFGRSALQRRVFTQIGRTLTRCVLRANRVAVTIPAYADLLTDRYGADNVVVSPHGTFPMETVTSGSGGPRRLLAFGKFGTYKKVEVLLDAARLLQHAGYEDIEVVIAGTDAANTPGYLDEMRQTYADLPGLRFTGYVEEDDVPRLFQEATMVIFPYIATTGSSGPLHQAGAAGKPVVLPEIADFVEVINDEGFTGMPFIPGDAMSLASAIARLLDNPQLRQAMGSANQHAATAVSIGDVADWHVLHLADLAGAGR